MACGPGGTGERTFWWEKLIQRRIILASFPNLNQEQKVPVLGDEQIVQNKRIVGDGAGI